MIADDKSLDAPGSAFSLLPTGAQVDVSPDSVSGAASNVLTRMRAARLTCWTVLVGDAGQFFEVVGPAGAINAVRCITREVQQRTGKSTVSVFRGSSVKGFLGGNTSAKTVKTCVFEFAELVLCFAACMLICFCKMGGIVFKMDGLPIGDLMSRIAASFALAWEEESFLRSRSKRESADFFVPGHSWGQLVGSSCVG